MYSMSFLITFFLDTKKLPTWQRVKLIKMDDVQAHLLVH
jgi:hypothetical protein